MMRGVGPCFAAATLAAALSLAISSDGSSIYGLTSILAGAFWPVVGMGAALELGKLSAVTYLGPALRCPAVMLGIPDLRRRRPTSHDLLKFDGANIENHRKVSSAPIEPIP